MPVTTIYSFIKDRRGNPVTNAIKNKWFKFNTYFHVRRSQMCVMADWVDAIGAIVTVCSTTSS